LTTNKEYICEQLQDLLKQISMAFSCTLSKVLEDSALTFHQVYVMKVISGKTSVNLTTLCRELNLTKGAMSLTLNRLVEEGYVLRLENPEDRRNRNFILTDKGKEVLRSTNEKIREALGRLTCNLTEKELEDIKNSLAKLNSSMYKALGKLKNN